MTEPRTFRTRPGTIADLIRSRRTIHNFRADAIPDTVILEAIESARWAQNHFLTEPWHFYLIGPVTAAAISELNSEIVHAERGENAAQIKLKRWLAMPSWLVVTCSRSTDQKRQREDYSACCCAIQNLSLHLWSEGVGMKWTTGPVTRDPHFYDLIGSDIDLEEVVGLFWYGHPTEIPATKRVKSVAEITQRLD